MISTKKCSNLTQNIMLRYQTHVVTQNIMLRYQTHVLTQNIMLTHML